MRNPTDEPAQAITDDLDVLRAAYPDWFFTTCWAAVNAGPDRRLLVAQRRGVVLAAFTATGMRAKIAHENES